jgi:hypothetical protein
MTNLDQFLAEVYGDEPLATEKQAMDKQAAMVDLFEKVAQVSGLDFSQGTQDDVQQTFNLFAHYEKCASEQGVNLWGGQYTVGAVADGFAKFAAEMEQAQAAPQVDEEANMAASYLHKMASDVRSDAELVARADVFGKLAAHAMVAELQTKMATEGGEAAAAGEAATEAAKKAPGYISKALEKMKGNPKTTAGIAAGTLLAAGGVKALHSHLKNKKKDEEPKLVDTHNEGPKEEGGAAKAAFDRLAAQEAYAYAVSNGMNEKNASERIGAALAHAISMPTTDNVKTAAAQDDFSSALAIRAGELLELAGYSFQ